MDLKNYLFTEKIVSNSLMESQFVLFNLIYFLIFCAVLRFYAYHPINNVFYSYFGVEN